MKIDTYTMLGSVVKDKDGKPACSGTVDVIKVEDLDKYIDSTIEKLTTVSPTMSVFGAVSAVRSLKGAITRAPKR